MPLIAAKSTLLLLKRVYQLKLQELTALWCWLWLTNYLTCTNFQADSISQINFEWISFRELNGLLKCNSCRLAFLTKGKKFAKPQTGVRII